MNYQECMVPVCKRAYLPIQVAIEEVLLTHNGIDSPHLKIDITLKLMFQATLSQVFQIMLLITLIMHIMMFRDKVIAVQVPELTKRQENSTNH
jgi:hypothetical protein